MSRLGIGWLGLMIALTILRPGPVLGGCDFDGDGLDDLALYGAQTWHSVVHHGGMNSFPFGTTGSLPAPGDFDGNGATDPAVYTPETGMWHIMGNFGGFESSVHFGFPGTLPVVADYDSDGFDDIAVYHPPTGRWYVSSSSAGYRQWQFGYGGTIPLAYDFDGDGQIDIGVYDPASAQWYIMQSAKGFRTLRFGWWEAVPVPADYDGDGAVDIAVYHAASGSWYILGSSSHFEERRFGYGGTVPIVDTDLDGDGKADLVLFHGEDQRVYAMRSSEGFRTLALGGPGNVPVPGPVRYYHQVSSSATRPTGVVSLVTPTHKWRQPSLTLTFRWVLRLPSSRKVARLYVVTDKGWCVFDGGRLEDCWYAGANSSMFSVTLDRVRYGGQSFEWGVIAELTDGTVHYSDTRRCYNNYSELGSW